MSIKNFLTKINNRDTALLPKFSKLTKTILVLTVFTFGFFFVRQILAANANQAVADFEAKQAAITTGNNQEAWLDSAITSNSISLLQSIVGPIPEGFLTGQTVFVPGGILGFSNKTIASLYNPPASGINYIATSFNNFLGKPAYAQGVGFNGLKGIQQIWMNFRNATYALFSIFFVVIGIMIMLRVKISPQAVISIQNSIPKIITTLILITFSYAIAGLLIDLSYLFLGLALTVVKGSQGNLDIPAEITNPDVYGRFMRVFPFLNITAVIFSISSSITNLIPGGGVTGDITRVAAAIGLSLGTLAIIALIVSILCLIFTIKFLFGLAKCYLNLILRIILGPLEIAMGAIPSMKMGFSSWLMNIIANLSVFPITIVILILLEKITTSLALSSNPLWVPPALSGLGTSLNNNIVGAIIGIAGFMLVSKLPDLIPEFIFQLKPSPFGKAIGENMTNNVVAGAGAFGWGVVKSGVGKNLSDRIKFGKGPADTQETTTTRPPAPGTGGGPTPPTPPSGPPNPIP